MSTWSVFRTRWQSVCVWRTLNWHCELREPPQLSTLATLDVCPSWSSETNPPLFLRPFILRVCSLDRSCFCMWTWPNLVPKASWEMFFFFLGCNRETVLITNLFFSDVLSFCGYFGDVDKGTFHLRGCNSFLRQCKENYYGNKIIKSLILCQL